MTSARQCFLALVVAFVPVAPAHSVSGAPAPSPEFRGLQIVLYVSDVKKSVEFYRDQLGFRLDFYLVGDAREVRDLSSSDPEPYGADLIAGSQRIGLQRNDGEVHLPASGARYHFEVDDPEMYFSRLQSQGLNIHHVVRTANGKPFMFSVTDPDGHWLFFRATQRR